MWAKSQQYAAAYGPGLVLGLFVGRLGSELVAMLGQRPIGLWLAVSVTTTAVLLCILTLRSRPLRHTWPLLLLLVYVFYPYPSWLAAATGATAVLLLFLWQSPKPTGMNSRWGETAVYLLLFATSLTLYLVTLAPDLLPADSGEFQLVAATLGVAHPPGFPLYTILGYLMTRLPLGETAAYRLNLFSALTSAATLLLLLASVRQLTRSYWGGITAVMALASATTFWAQATTSNIRSLTAFFAALALYWLLRFRAATQSGDTPAADRALVWFALALGLGLGHHFSLAFMGLIFVIFIIATDSHLLRTPRRWPRPILVGLAGLLLPMLYLPLRANSGAPGATPDLATLEGFLNHVLGLGFRGDFLYYREPAIFLERLRMMGDALTFQFSPWLLAGAAFGLVLLFWRDRSLAWLLGGAFGLHLLITATYRAPQTVEYMMPAYPLLALCLGYAVAWLMGDGPKAFRALPAAPQLAALLAVGLVGTAVWQTITHYPSYRALSQIAHHRDYAQNLLAHAPADSAILADWHWATPLWYLQIVEGQRPDLTTQFVYPRSADYGADWAAQIAAGLADGRAVIATHFAADAYAALPPPEPLGDAFLFNPQPRHDLPPDYKPLDIILGDSLQLLGYQLAQADTAIGQEAILTLAWQPRADLPSPLSLFAHLVGFDGRIYAQQDVTAQPAPEGISLTQFRLTPRPGAQPGDYALLVGAYGAEPLLAEDGAARSPIATLPVTAMPAPPYTAQPSAWTTTESTPRRLSGHDWDHSLPERPRLYLHWQTADGYVDEVLDSTVGHEWPLVYGAWGVARQLPPLEPDGEQVYLPLGQGIVWIGSGLTGEPLEPGQSLWLRPRYAASAPVLSDLVASVRLIGYEADGYHWDWWDLSDSIPALGAIPTLKWIAGSQVTDRHGLQVSPEATSGQAIGATLRFYDAFTGRALPILDERITDELQLPWVPLGETAVP
jgi:hypothetical protein